MARRKLTQKNIRKIGRIGGSFSVTLPIELVKQLKWRERQKVVVKKRGRGIIISDWKK